MQRVRKQIDFFPEYGMADGGGVTIAVLDTGICGHPDLEGKTYEFRDFVGNRELPYDDNGHGTHVCGILCGTGKLSGGRYRGMAPGAGLVVGKVLDKNGGGSTEAMLSGLDWILAMRRRYRIRILNISVGIGNLEEKGKERALRQKVEQVWDSGILVVCAAGNKGPGDGTISDVGGSGKVITVGCYDGAYRRNESGLCAAYSGRGVRNGSPRKPDIVAPGTDIMSCSVHYYRRSAYVAKSGTSMATPIVAGAAALAFQRYPHMTNESCRQKLLFTATDLHLPWNQQGWGMVNVKRLLG
ncbi:MAG: S8 family peptidase [Butyrivibrio sp.]|nr:S8 family peptidase [Acetatifactor muris]MCM1559235.1 S8 family peptidase [Butyrivibrio sp.]